MKTISGYTKSPTFQTENETAKFYERIEKVKTRLYLKSTKTPKSVRTIYMTEPYFMKLLVWKKIQLQDKLYRIDYNDYDLVFAYTNGNPIEPNRLEKWFKKRLHKSNNKLSRYELPDIVFHGLRHSSTTYKIEIMAVI